MSSRPWGKAVGSVLLVAGLVAACWYVFLRTDDAKSVTANFSYVNGIYVGSKVTVLGVQVGTVTEVTPQGATVRVRMSMPDSVRLPADASAYVLNPSVISDRHVELGPVYRGGPLLTDGAVIPPERSHAPIDFDGLMGSISTLTAALGSEGQLGGLLTQTADGWRGQGEAFNSAITNLSAATGVVGARSADIGALVANLGALLTALDARQVDLDGMVAGLGELGEHWAAQELDLAAPMRDLRVVLDEVDAFMAEHGDDVGIITQNVNALGAVLTTHAAGLAEFMDLVPLLMQNVGNTVGEDDRARIRLNITTALTQFSEADRLCEQLPMPLCTGAGLTNPISFPISASDPLGIVSVLSGRAPQGGN